jgi:hydrogenase nickel incorporation protein HypB
MNSTVITIGRDVQAETRLAADDFRHQLAVRRTLVVNLVSSPGTGKTSLLTAMARHWGDTIRMAVLVGDLATDRDAQRLAPYMPVVQLTTGGACHLELPLVDRGWQALGAPDVDFLFIENVGNLVCPASFDLGEHLRVVLLSVTEGDDKPGKYPKMFRTSRAMVISKSDLLPYVPFSAAAAAADARKIQPAIEVFSVSALHDQGVGAWCDYLTEFRRQLFANESANAIG